MSGSSGRQRRPHLRAGATASGAARGRHSVSVDRGFAILKCFTGHRGSAGISDIADSIGLPRSSVHRYMQTLSALGLVEQRGMPGRRYRLTARAAGPGIAAIAATGIPDAAHGELIGLRQATGCTARLAVRLDLDALLVDQAPSLAPDQRLLALEARPGARLPGMRSALGQALLADLDSRALPLSMRRQARAAQPALASVRGRGYAIEEREDGEPLCAIAVPIHAGEGQTIAAIDLLGHEPAITLEALTPHLDSLQAVAARLGPVLAELPWTQWRPYLPRRPRL